MEGFAAVLMINVPGLAPAATLPTHPEMSVLGIPLKLIVQAMGLSTCAGTTAYSQQPQKHIASESHNRSSLTARFSARCG